MATLPNQFPFRGSSAILQLASLDSPSGNFGQTIFNTEYNIGTVGRVTGLELHITTDLEVFHEIGTRQGQDLSPGNINIFGRVERAYINGALIRMLMGRLGGAGANEDTIPEEMQPNFNMIFNFHDPRSGNATFGTRLTLTNVRFDDWVLVVPEDDFVLENMTFKALRIQREEVA